jgi:hypothetical protein
MKSGACRNRHLKTSVHRKSMARFSPPQHMQWRIACRGSLESYRARFGYVLEKSVIWLDQSARTETVRRSSFDTKPGRAGYRPSSVQSGERAIACHLHEGSDRRQIPRSMTSVSPV